VAFHVLRIALVEASAVGDSQDVQVFRLVDVESPRGSLAAVGAFNRPFHRVG